jgi:hypothetical protein
MNDKPRRGFPAKYVLLKLLVLPEDRAYVKSVQAAQGLPSLNETGRLIFGEARAAHRFLGGHVAQNASEQE